MTTWIVAALPVAPGRSDRCRNFEREIAPNMDEFERLNREATVTRYATYLAELPQGDVAIHIMEAEDPTKLRASFTDSEYDRWWLDFLSDVHGVDLGTLRPEEIPPPLAPVFRWEA